MHIPWDDMSLFLAVAETGSLSAAAARLNVTQPTVSRRVAELEARVGEALFARTAIGATITTFGESLLEPARRMAEWAVELERAAERAETTPRGIVRITAPPGIAFDFLAPFAAAAREALPAVRFTVIATTDYLDLSRGGADLALRFAAPAQRDVVTLATLDVPIGAFGSKAYARTLPPHATPSDVAWIAWAPPYENMSPNPELAKMIPSFEPVFASDDFLVQLRAAEAGLGAMFLGRATHRFAKNDLVLLDVVLPPIHRSLHLVATKRALEIPRVRAVADLLVAELHHTMTPEKEKQLSEKLRRPRGPDRARGPSSRR